MKLYRVIITDGTSTSAMIYDEQFFYYKKNAEDFAHQEKEKNSYFAATIDIIETMDRE